MLKSYLSVFVITIILFLFQGRLSAQYPDSLWLVYKDQQKPDKQRLSAIEAITQHYLRSRPDSAILLANLELALAKKINNKKDIGHAFSLRGTGYYYIGNYPASIGNHTEGLKLFEESDYKEGIASAHNNIGIIYFEQKNFPNALEEFNRSLEVYKELRDTIQIASISGNIGNVYYSMNKLQESLKVNIEALVLLKKSNAAPFVIANTISNIGVAYQGLKNYPEAHKYFNEALSLRQANGDDLGVEISLVNLASLYCSEGNYLQAEVFIDKALLLANELNDLEGLKEIYQIQTEIYGNTNRPAKALDSYKAYNAAKDSLINEENTRQILQTQMQYQFEKKEALLKAEQVKKDAIAAVEGKRQKLILLFVSGILFLTAVFAVISYRRFQLTRKQKKIIEQKEKEAQEQNLIISQQKYVVEQKHKEITDSINYAERIQRSFLATEQHLEDNLNEYFIFFKPKDVVSGDFYWSATLNNGLFALVTADSTGHGVPGAIMSLLNITSLEKAIETYNNPSGILNATREIIINRLKKDGSIEGGKDGMDASLCVFDFKSLKLLVAAAHNPVWIVRGKDVIEIKPDKMPIGKHDKDQIPFTKHEVQLEKGDVVYTLTDGFPDQFGGPLGKKFMSKKLRELLVANAHLPMREQKELLEQTFANWLGNIEQVDDVTLIGVRV